MGYETMKILKAGPKGTISLVFDTEQHCMLVEKRLAGKLEIYQKLQTLPHPYLPKLYDVRHENGQTVILEEYIQGGSLGAIHATERQLTRWLKELCEVLQFLHSHHILHRDIKPSNLLLGSDGHIRLIDFDAAREKRSGAEQDTRLLGTRGYAPPEQYGHSQTDERSDIYALGVTFRELLGPAARKGRWRRILRKCTAQDPKERYAAAGRIRRAIYLGQIIRWGIRPVCLLLAGLAAAFAISLFANPSSRLALFSILGTADTSVWEGDSIDAEALQKAVEEGTAPLMYEYSGSEALAAYELVQARHPDMLIVYSGYMDREGGLVYGCIETTFSIRAGAYTFNGLHSIVRVTTDGAIEPIEVDVYDAYAPAVMEIYLAIEQMPRFAE